jgi:hypothetical protein
VTRAKSNGDEVPKATPSKLGRILKGAHDRARTERAIADTAVGRRVKAQQDKKEGKGKR